jgi:Trk-type K+ transport system membrane component
MFTFMNKMLQKKIIPKIIFLVLGISLSIIGLYYFHMQYLCYEYTALQFILAVVVCLGGALLSLPLSRNSGKKKKVKNAIITAFTFAVVLVGLMLFLPAGTTDYPNGWLFILLLFVPMFLLGV